MYYSAIRKNREFAIAKAVLVSAQANNVSNIVHNALKMVILLWHEQRWSYMGY